MDAGPVERESQTIYIKKFAGCLAWMATQCTYLMLVRGSSAVTNQHTTVTNHSWMPTLDAGSFRTV